MRTYRDRIPSYALAPVSFLEEVRIGTTVSFQVAVSILRGDTEPLALDEPLKEVGRRRAAQGIPLGDALLAWQISTRAFWETIMELVPDDPETRAEVLQVTTLVILELLEHAVAAVSAGYMEVEQARVADEEHDIQSVIETLAGLRLSDSNFEAAAARQGIDPALFQWCFVSVAPTKNVGEVVRMLRHSWPGAAVGRVGSSVVSYCSGSTIPPDVEFRPVGGAPVGEPALAYSQARSAARAAEHLGRDFVRYAEVAPLAMIRRCTGGSAASLPGCADRRAPRRSAGGRACTIAAGFLRGGSVGRIRGAHAARTQAHARVQARARSEADIG